MQQGRPGPRSVLSVFALGACDVPSLQCTWYCSSVENIWRATSCFAFLATRRAERLAYTPSKTEDAIYLVTNIYSEYILRLNPFCQGRGDNCRRADPKWDLTTGS